MVEQNSIFINKQLSFCKNRENGVIVDYVGTHGLRVVIDYADTMSLYSLITMARCRHKYIKYLSRFTYNLNCTNFNIFKTGGYLNCMSTRTCRFSNQMSLCKQKKFAKLFYPVHTRAQIECLKQKGF